MALRAQKMVIPLSFDTSQILSEDAAERLVGAICFKTGPPGTVGAELEWLVTDRTDPSLPLPLSRIQRVLEALQHSGAMSGGGLLTLEPGGQVELSTAPAANLTACVAAASADLAVLREAFGTVGLTLLGSGLDPVRHPRRTLHLPRYTAMEEYFDRRGAWGRLMMNSTASVQVCVDAGQDVPGPSGLSFRWRLLHALGPVLIAAFANSPLRNGRPTGWKCTRQLIWHHLDPGRTRAPAGTGPTSADDPRAAWTRYALDAELLCVRRPDSEPWTAPPGLSFRGWLRGTSALPARRGPTADDLSYHLSTLFPPVRPRGHLELRMIDAQPGDNWIVPLAVTATLADDPIAAEAAMAASAPVWHPPAGSPDGAGGPWLRAAKFGLADPVLAHAARECFAIAGAALDRSGAAAMIRTSVASFADRYVSRDRCPADDVLDQLSEGPS